MNGNISSPTPISLIGLKSNLASHFISFKAVRAISKQKYLALAVLHRHAEIITEICDQELLSSYIITLKKCKSPNSSYIRRLEEVLGSEDSQDFERFTTDRRANKLGMKFTRDLIKQKKKSLRSSAESLDILAFALEIRIITFDYISEKEINITEVGNNDNAKIYLLKYNEILLADPAMDEERSRIIDNETWYILYPNTEIQDLREFAITQMDPVMKHCFCHPRIQDGCEHKAFRIDYELGFPNPNKPRIDVREFLHKKLSFNCKHRQSPDQQRSDLRHAISNLEEQISNINLKIEEIDDKIQKNYSERNKCQFCYELKSDLELLTCECFVCKDCINKLPIPIPCLRHGKQIIGKKTDFLNFY